MTRVLVRIDYRVRFKNYDFLLGHEKTNQMNSSFSVCLVLRAQVNYRIRFKNYGFLLGHEKTNQMNSSFSVCLVLRCIILLKNIFYLKKY